MHSTRSLLRAPRRAGASVRGQPARVHSTLTWLYVYAATLTVACGGDVDAPGKSTGAASNAAATGSGGTMGTASGSGGEAANGGSAGSAGFGGVAGSGGAQLPSCMEQSDCGGTAICQDGFCCAGEYLNGKCMCGDGPGCDLLHTCCPPDTDPEAGPQCVNSSSDCVRPSK